MDDGVHRVKRRRLVVKKRPLWRRRPGLVVMVIVAIGLVAVLIVSAVTGLLEVVGDVLGVGVEEEPAVSGDTDTQDCMDSHRAALYGEMPGFRCRMPCESCHLEEP